MTDIPTAAPTTTQSLGLPRLGLPKLAIGASLSAISGVISDAVTLAYVAPYTNLRRQEKIVRDDDLDGRDPNW